MYPVKAKSVFHGFVPFVSFPSLDAYPIYSSSRDMRDVFEQRNAYYAFRPDGLYVNACRLGLALTWYYTLPEFWGIDLLMPPPEDAFIIEWVRAAWVDFPDKVFSRYNHQEGQLEQGGLVTKEIRYSKMKWKHESTGAVLDAIPVEWYGFGRGYYNNTKYLSWWTTPLVPGISPIIAIFALLTSTMLTGTTDRPYNRHSVQ